MQSRALELLVGFFVCLGIAAVFVLTFRIASVDHIGSSGGYEVIAKFDNSGSLVAGASVKMAGVKIGRVQSIDIDPYTFQAVVTMQIDANRNNIPDDSSAKIQTAGLLGEQYVGLDPGGDDKPLKEGSEIKFTQSALVLENLIGQFMANMASGGSKKDDAPADKKPDASAPAAPTPAK
jgi:phospholipid/cholesterol/gamma-HCH transport system substrate-binding protein